MENFGKKIKKIAQVGAFVALGSAVPIAKSQKIEEIIPKEVSVSNTKDKSLDDKKVVSYDTLENNNEQILSKEYLVNILKKLRSRVGENVLKKYTPINGDGDSSGDDHIILSVGNEQISNEHTYFDYIYSIRLMQRKSGIDENRKRQNDLKNDFKKELNETKKKNLFENKKDQHEWETNYLANINKTLSLIAEEEKSIDESLELESGHAGALVYSLIRSGLYDKWKSEDSILARKIERSIQVEKNDEKLFFDYMKHDYEWKLLILVELAKRGLDTTFYQHGNSNQDSFHMEYEKSSMDHDYLEALRVMGAEELYFLNLAEELYGNRFSFDYDNESKKDSMINEYLSFVPEDLTKEEIGFLQVAKEQFVSWKKSIYGLGSTCSGSHALHAMVAWDIYSNNERRLKTRIKTSVERLKKILDENNLNSSEDAFKYLHDFPHFLLPFTELKDDSLLSQEEKCIIQESFIAMCELAEKYAEDDKSFEKHSIMELAHPIEVIDNFPRFLLEK